MSHRDDLVGCWRLAEWDCTLDGAPHRHPFGRDAQGLLVYTADGVVSAILMRAGRPLLSRASLALASDQERAGAASGYVSYAGRYRIEGDTVVHAVEYSLLPNWIGTELVRTIGWHGRDTLVLETRPERTASGREVINRLRWNRDVR